MIDDTLHFFLYLGNPVTGECKLFVCQATEDSVRKMVFHDECFFRVEIAYRLVKYENERTQVHAIPVQRGDINEVHVFGVVYLVMQISYLVID